MSKAWSTWRFVGTVTSRVTSRHSSVRPRSLLASIALAVCAQSSSHITLTNLQRGACRMLCKSPVKEHWSQWKSELVNSEHKHTYNEQVSCRTCFLAGSPLLRGFSSIFFLDDYFSVFRALRELILHSPFLDPLLDSLQLNSLHHSLPSFSTTF